jgi:hypothetical protein
MRSGGAEYAQEGPAVKLSRKIFFFEFDLSHR